MRVRSEISPTEKELRFTRCLKAKDIADNTLFVPSLNTLTRTKLNTAVVNDFLP